MYILSMQRSMHVSIYVYACAYIQWSIEKDICIYQVLCLSSYIYMYVNISGYASPFILGCVYINVSTHIYIYVCMSMHRMHISIYTCIHTYVDLFTCVYMSIHLPSHLAIHQCQGTHTYIYIYVCVSICLSSYV